jgi:hypothetical protein
MFSRHDGTEARLYDVREDSLMRNDVSGSHPDIVERMFGNYVIKEAGGPLPTYGF